MAAVTSLLGHSHTAAPPGPAGVPSSITAAEQALVSVASSMTLIAVAAALSLYLLLPRLVPRTANNTLYCGVLVAGLLWATWRLAALLLHSVIEDTTHCRVFGLGEAWLSLTYPLLLTAFWAHVGWALRGMPYLRRRSEGRIVVAAMAAAVIVGALFASLVTALRWHKAHDGDGLWCWVDGPALRWAGGWAWQLLAAVPLGWGLLWPLWCSAPLTPEVYSSGGLSPCRRRSVFGSCTEADENKPAPPRRLCCLQPAYWFTPLEHSALLLRAAAGLACILMLAASVAARVSGMAWLGPLPSALVPLQGAVDAVAFLLSERLLQHRWWRTDVPAVLGFSAALSDVADRAAAQCPDPHHMGSSAMFIPDPITPDARATSQQR